MCMGCVFGQASSNKPVIAMNSRPLLDYLLDAVQGAPDDAGPDDRLVDTMEARLRELAAKLREQQPGAQEQRPPKQEESDLTLSAQIEAILKRKGQAERVRYATSSERLPERFQPRAVIDPPPMQPAMEDDTRALDADFIKFTEAVYLIGQAARRFIDQPQPASPVQYREPPPAAPSTGEIDALSAVLRETVSAFRSVADDLAVSAGEIRIHATREPLRRETHRPSRRSYRDDDEIHELRETVAELQGRLDDLLPPRRRSRY
ncbi:MAG: hypothetical protein JWL86_1141 [Rhizobium sp.]|nr:hypothetical protein [Rhizobium sp.]